MPNVTIEVSGRRLMLDAQIRGKNGLTRLQLAKQIRGTGGLNETGRKIQALSLVFHHFIGKNEMTHENDLEDPR